MAAAAPPAGGTGGNVNVGGGTNGGVGGAGGGGGAVGGNNWGSTGGGINIQATPSWSASQSASQNQGAGYNQSISGTGIIGGLESLYSQLLGVNQQRYGNVLSAYQGQMGNINAQTPQIAAGYGQVQQGIANTLGQGGSWGVATPAAQAIQQAYGQQQGATTQQMTNAGLGNTTAVGNAQAQNTAGAAQAFGGLGAQLAQTYAGYQSQEGNAALAALMQGQGMQTSLTSGALNPLGSQLQNTFGSLTGNYSASQGANYNMGNSASASYSAGPTQGAYAPGSLGPTDVAAIGNAWLPPEEQEAPPGLPGLPPGQGNVGQWPQ